MQAGASDSISYLPTILMNHWALIKLTMPLSLPAADAEGGLCVSALCGTTPEDSQACMHSGGMDIDCIFYRLFQFHLLKKKKKKHCKQLFAK